MSEEWFEFEVLHDNGDYCAGAGGTDRARALKEAMHYAAVYSQDAPVEIYEVKRERIASQPQDERIEA